jgi:hypothetical protein
MMVAKQLQRMSSVLLIFGECTYETGVEGRVQFGWKNIAIGCTMLKMKKYTSINAQEQTVDRPGA